MIIAFLSQAAASALAACAALLARVQLYHERRAIRQLLLLDDRTLHDIGLSRSDVIGCLSSPHDDPADFFEQRRKSRSLRALPEVNEIKIAA